MSADGSSMTLHHLIVTQKTLRSVSECAQCGVDIIAPEWSEHFTDHCVRNVWSCEACGYWFEDTVYLSADEFADAD
jgi:C4-type Zn-finger protein